MRAAIAGLCIICALIGGSEGVPLWLDLLSLIVCGACVYYWIKLDPQG